MLLVSCDDKCALKVGVPGNSLALVPKSKVDWTAKLVEVKAVDYGACIKSNVVPSATLMMKTPNDYNLGKLSGGEIHVGLKENSMHKSYCVRHSA